MNSLAPPIPSSAAASFHGAATPSLELLEARQLRDALKILLRKEQAAMAEFLSALADFDRHRGWEPLGHASLFAFLRAELGLSSGAAFWRMSAARLLQRFPDLVEALRHDPGRSEARGLGARSRALRLAARRRRLVRLHAPAGVRPRRPMGERWCAHRGRDPAPVQASQRAGRASGVRRTVRRTVRQDLTPLEHPPQRAHVPGTQAGLLRSTLGWSQRAAW